jgi:hypothetical protein
VHDIQVESKIDAELRHQHILQMGELRRSFIESFSPEQIRLLLDLADVANRAKAKYHEWAFFHPTDLGVGEEDGDGDSEVERAENEVVPDIQNKQEELLRSNVFPNDEAVTRSRNMRVQEYIDIDEAYEDENQHSNAHGMNEARMDEDVGIGRSGLSTLPSTSNAGGSQVPAVTSSPTFTVSEFDASQHDFGGLIDTVCHVAAEAVWMFSKDHRIEFVIKSLDKLVTAGMDCLVDVSGSVAQVEGSTVHVLVRVRETSPTGQRKRIRVLGSAVVTFESPAGRTACALNPKSIRARKDSAAVESRFANIEPELAIKSLLAEMTYTVPIDNSMELGASLYDGGNLLLWMSLAAEETARSSLTAKDKRSKFKTRAVHSFHVANFFDGSLHHVGASMCLRARIGRVLFNEVYVKVTVSDRLAEGEEFQRAYAQATFAVLIDGTQGTS